MRMFPRKQQQVSDYEFFQKILQEAVRPALEQLRELKDDFSRMRVEFRTDTYTREMVDAKFKDINDDISNLKEQLATDKKERQETIAKVIAIISTTLLVLSQLPNLLQGFSH